MVLYDAEQKVFIVKTFVLNVQVPWSISKSLKFWIFLMSLETVLEHGKEIWRNYFCAMQSQRCIVYRQKMRTDKTLQTVKETKEVRGSNFFMCPNSLAFVFSDTFPGFDHKGNRYFRRYFIKLIIIIWNSVIHSLMFIKQILVNWTKFGL
jgi:hypothetical protein